MKTAACIVAVLVGLLLVPGARAEDVRVDRLHAILRELKELQTGGGGWTRQGTKKMMELVRQAQALDLKLPVEHTLVQLQNRLVQNMHDCLAYCTQRMSAGQAVMIRMGKHPWDPAFGGLATARPSDFDVTYAGRVEAAAKQRHAVLAHELFGADFAETTRVAIAEADATLAALSAREIKNVFNKIALKPDLHRTYSGLRYVDDYILSKGSITYLEGDRVVTLRSIDMPTDVFARRINEQLSRVGSRMRVGTGESGFALGLVSDTVRQIELNIGRGDPATLVRAKYMDRYLTALDNAGLSRPPEAEVARLKGLAENSPRQFSAEFHAFEKNVIARVARAQGQAYRQAVAAGNPARAEIILADSMAAIYHFERHGGKEAALSGMGEYASHVQKRLLHERFLDAGEFLLENQFRVLPEGVRFFDRWAIGEFIKNNRLFVAFQVGGGLFTLKMLWDTGVAGDDDLFLQALATAAVHHTFMDGVPLLLAYYGMAEEAIFLSTVSGGVILLTLGAKLAGDYAVHCLTSIASDNRAVGLLCGVGSDGHDRQIPDLLDELGVPLLPVDLAAPGTIQLGEFNNEKLVKTADEDGNVTIRYLKPAFHDEWDQGERSRHLGWFDESSSWVVVTLSPGQMVAQSRMRRVYDRLRREYLAFVEENPPPRVEHPAELYVPTLEVYVPSPGHALRLDEHAYYLRRFHEAFHANWGAYATASSSLHEGIDESAKRASLLMFVQQMIRYSEEDEHVRNAFWDVEDPGRLQLILDAGMPVHFDGKDLTRKEIEDRLVSVRISLIEGREQALSEFDALMRRDQEEEAEEARPLERGWHLFRCELEYFVIEDGASTRKRNTWYIPKKVRGKKTIRDLLASTYEQYEEEIEKGKGEWQSILSGQQPPPEYGSYAVSFRVSHHQGPFERIPRERPESATGEVLGPGPSWR